MRLKELESWLTQCEGFEKPKIVLEQYATSAHIAARMLYSAKEVVEGGIVCDLGSGCGVLSIGAVMMGAGLVIGFEMDEDAINIAKRNVAEILEEEEEDEDEAQAPPIQFVQAKVGVEEAEGSDGLERFEGLFDVVMMNPPFGTKKNVGADFQFLKRALSLVRPGGHVYSLHKTSTRPFFQKKVAKSEEELGFPMKGEVEAAIRYDLPKCYKFHKEKSVDIEVDFWHFQKSESEVSSSS